MNLLLMIAVSLAAAGCSHLKTRGDIGRDTKEKADSTTVSHPTNASESHVPPQPPAPQSSKPPTFLDRELPKVGLILGPGGMKAYAHLGVLRELARARVPIHSIVGLEWGALIGGLYAVQGQVNDAEWKAFKLRDEDVSGDEGFLSARSKSRPIGKIAGFIDESFGAATIERSRIDFACPAHWWSVDRFGFLSRGSFKEAMRACLPYPPLFSDNGGVTAAPLSVQEAAAHLRARGANLIVLVNVLGQGEFLPDRLAAERPGDNILWSEIRHEMLQARSPYVHYVINVNTKGHPVTDVAGRRALLEAGAKSATEVIEKMANQYGF